MADPTSPGRMAWDFVLVIPLLAYLSIVMPFKLCMGYENAPMSPMALWELSIDFIFILDIVLNFRTGFLDEHYETVYDPKRVARNYLKGCEFVVVFASLSMGGVNSSLARSRWLVGRVPPGLRERAAVLRAGHGGRRGGEAAVGAQVVARAQGAAGAALPQALAAPQGHQVPHLHGPRQTRHHRR